MSSSTNSRGRENNNGSYFGKDFEKLICPCPSTHTIIPNYISNTQTTRFKYSIECLILKILLVNNDMYLTFYMTILKVKKGHI